MKYTSKSGKFKNTSVNVYLYRSVQSPGLIITKWLCVFSGSSLTLGLCSHGHLENAATTHHATRTGNCRPICFCDRKSEPSIPEWGCQSCRWLSVGMGWGTLAERGAGEGLLHYICFSPNTAVHGGYVTEFDQNLRLHCFLAESWNVPCFLAESWTEVNQRTSVQGGSLYYSCCLRMIRWSFVLCPSVPSGPRQGCVLK